MVTQKVINLLNDSGNHPYKFATKNGMLLIAKKQGSIKREPHPVHNEFN